MPTICPSGEILTGRKKCIAQLGFRDPKKMFMHYGKHLYDEGKVFAHIPPVDGSADGFDEFGRIYRWITFRCANISSVHTCLEVRLATANLFDKE